MTVGAGIAQSVKRLAQGWTVRGSNPGGQKIFHTRPGQWSHHTPSALKSVHLVFSSNECSCISQAFGEICNSFLITVMGETETISISS